jgi:hypothetical protein
MTVQLGQVNNAGIGGFIIDADGFKAQSESGAVVSLSTFFRC